MTLGSTASLKQILQDVNGSFEVGTAYFPSITDDDKGGVSIGGAVSYTHLDVYKRQLKKRREISICRTILHQ